MNEKIFNEKVKEWREYQTLKAETEAKLKELEESIKEYMETNTNGEAFTPDAKVTYKSQERESFDKKAAELDGVDIAKYSKKTSYKVLRIK